MNSLIKFIFFGPFIHKKKTEMYVRDLIAMINCNTIRTPSHRHQYTNIVLFELNKQMKLWDENENNSHFHQQSHLLFSLKEKYGLY